MTSPPCPCGGANGYAACCGRWHRGEPAPTPEALMRSRYSAFVLGLRDHLLATWHSDTRPAVLVLDDDVRWLGLEVRAARADTVEFVARSRLRGRATRLHETSRFVRGADGRWLYLDGVVVQPKRTASGGG